MFDFNQWLESRCFESHDLEVYNMGEGPVRIPGTHRVHYLSHIRPMAAKTGEGDGYFKIMDRWERRASRRLPGY